MSRSHKNTGPVLCGEEFGGGRTCADLSGQGTSLGREHTGSYLQQDSLLGGAFVGAMPGGGGTTQTAVNVLAGARTQVAEIVTAVMALLTILFLSPFIGLTPQSALVAIVIVFYCALRLHQWFVERTRPVARFLFLD